MKNSTIATHLYPIQQRTMCWITTTNHQIALWVTEHVSTMWCAYLFAILAILGFPIGHDIPIIIGWFSTTFTQLVMLPLLLVVQSIFEERLIALLTRIVTDVEYLVQQRTLIPVQHTYAQHHHHYHMHLYKPEPHTQELVMLIQTKRSLFPLTVEEEVA